MTYVHKKKKKTKNQRIKSPAEGTEEDQDQNEGNQADNEASVNAFVTQFPQTGGVARDD